MRMETPVNDASKSLLLEQSRSMARPSCHTFDAAGYKPDGLCTPHEDQC
jgi:hypothetical protein